MSFISILKSVLVVITGGFGSIGLFRDIKDKTTGAITTWGKVSLAGIFLSVSIGFIVQVRDSIDQTKQTEENSARTLQIVQNTEQSIVQIRRALTPLGVGEIWVQISGYCGERSSFKQACADVVSSNNRLLKATKIENKRWKNAELDILDDEETVIAFCNDDGSPALSIEFNSEQNALKGPVGSTGLTYRVRFEAKKYQVYSNGKIFSTLDLGGKWFAYFDNGLDEYKITSLLVHAASGEFLPLFNRDKGEVIKDCMSKYAKRRGYTHTVYGALPR